MTQWRSRDGGFWFWALSCFKDTKDRDRHRSVSKELGHRDALSS